MSHFPHGAIIAAQQARERRRRDEEEEEEMTRYFRKPEVFQSLLQEESIAGWELVEKLDNRRVRFKRSRESRRRDATLPPGYDPYRTNYGSSTARSVLIIGIAVMIALMTGLGVLGVGILGSSGDGTGLSIIWPIIGVGGFLVLMIGIIAIRRLR
ncbi:MAG: hypothetical protein P8Y68_14125 [Anaerolineales bacterium]